MIPGYESFWQNFIMPRITLFALLLAAFEITVGLLLINKGKWVKFGLVLSAVFNLFLVQMGLASPRLTGWQDFIANRMPNLIFIVLQIPLFFDNDKKTLVQSINKLFSPMKA